MNWRMNVGPPWLLALWACCIPPGAAALSVRASFAERVIEGLEPGGEYVLSAFGGPLAVRNAGGEAAKVEWELRSPAAAQLRDGYDPIPDPGWLGLERAGQALAPGGEAATDVRIRVPKDARLFGRWYQVQLRTKAFAEGGIETAMESRLLLRIADKGEEPPGERDRAGPGRLDCKPRKRSVENVPLGRPWRVAPELKLVNAGEAEARARLRVSPETEGLPEGYEPAPNPHFLKPPGAELRVGPDSVVDAALELEVPDQARYRGRHWAFRVEVGGRDGPKCTLLIATHGAQEKRR